MPAKKKTEIDRVSLLMERGIDIANRRLFVAVPQIGENPESEVGHPLVAAFLTGLHALEHFYDEPTASSKTERRDHIEVVFCTYGGETYPGLAIYNILAEVSSRVPIHMFIYGPCMSAGSVILQGATRRLMSKNSRMMLHWGTISYDGEHRDDKLDEWVREAKSINREYLNAYLRRCGSKMSEQELRSLMDIEASLDPERCLAKGLIDEVIDPRTIPQLPRR